MCRLPLRCRRATSGPETGGSDARGLCILVAVMICGHLLILTAGLGSAADSGQAAARSNQVAGVKAFPMDFDSGCMALESLGSALDAVGHPSPRVRLAAVSGSCFKFVYDTTGAYEPLRDLFPTDVLRKACDAMGFPDAHWEAGRPVSEVKAAVKREIDAGRPLLAPFLKNDAYHGFFVIVGYDYDAGVLYLEGALRDSGYVSVPIPERWDGPTAGPAGWADNPVFVLGEYREEEGSGAALGLDKALATDGIVSLKGGRLAYGSHPGELAYMEEPGPRQALYGLPAYRLLARDAAEGDLVVERSGREEADFALIWRLDAQLGQLEKDRGDAATALTYIVARVSGGKSIEVEDLVANVRRTVDDVKALRKIFWDEPGPQVDTPDEIVDYVKNSGSIVFSFAGHDKYKEELAGRGLKAFRTRWGPVIVADSPEKRLRARTLVRSLEARERATEVALEGIEDFIGPDLGVPPPEPRTGGPRQRR